MKVFSLTLVFLTLFAFTQAAWAPNHKMKADAMGLVNAGITSTFKSNFLKIINPSDQQGLLADFNQPTDDKRKTLIISALSSSQIFSIFGLKDAQCDANNDGFVAGSELPCLNKVWKYYVPK